MGATKVSYLKQKAEASLVTLHTTALSLGD